MSFDANWYFGKPEAEKYEAKILNTLSGCRISKRRDLGELPGGIVFEAKKLGLDWPEFLRAIEGMCVRGTAKEIDDSTYEIV